jgi:hypothetical protein
VLGNKAVMDSWDSLGRPDCTKYVPYLTAFNLASVHCIAIAPMLLGMHPYCLDRPPVTDLVRNGPIGATGLGAGVGGTVSSGSVTSAP